MGPVVNYNDIPGASQINNCQNSRESQIEAIFRGDGDDERGLDAVGTGFTGRGIEIAANVLGVNRVCRIE